MLPRLKASPKSNSEEYITLESVTDHSTPTQVSLRTNGKHQDSMPLMFRLREIPPEPPRSSPDLLKSTKREEPFFSEDSEDSTKLIELSEELLLKSEQLTT